MKNIYLKDKNIDKKVLNAFKKISPSRIKIEDRHIIDKYQKWHNQLFFNLKFPTKMFNQSKVIDFGCGTGEVDIILGKYGAKIFGFDFNNISIDRANVLKKKFELTQSLNFKVKDISKIKVKKNTYDIAFSAGVIAHVKNPKLLFEKMCDTTKVNGYLILGYVEDSGLIQRLFHRAIVQKFKTLDFNKQKKIALKFFPKHIERSIKYGARSADTVINDYIVNPLYNGLNIKDLNKWALKKNFRFYSSVPNLNTSFVANPAYIKQIDFLKTEYNTLLSFNRLRWMFAQNSDDKVFKKFNLNSTSLSKQIEDYMGSLYTDLQSDNINYSNLYKSSLKARKLNSEIYKYIENFNKTITANIFNSVESIINLTSALKENKIKSFNKSSTLTKGIFKGYNGLGTSYVIWEKLK